MRGALSRAAAGPLQGRESLQVKVTTAFGLRRRRVSRSVKGMAWQSITTAARRARVLICDELGRVQIGRSAGLRWYDDCGQLLTALPLWWMPLPESQKKAPEPANRPSRK